MRRKFLAYIFSLMSFSLISELGFAQNKDNADLHWGSNDTSLILYKGDEIILRLNFNIKEDKPYFYPIKTLGGQELGLLRPKDHPWHKGLWFSWKFINRVNYWEEDKNTNIPQGRSWVNKVQIMKGQDLDDGASVKLLLSYEDSSGIVLSEEREINIGSFGFKDGYFIKIRSHFLAKDNLSFDVTRPARYGGDYVYGGYGGLGIRGNEKLEDLVFIGSGGTYLNEDNLYKFDGESYGRKHFWMGMYGKINGKNASLLICDYRNNIRFPSSWFITNPKNRKFIFLNPAIFYDGIYELEKGQELNLEYLIAVKDEVLTFDYCDMIFDSFNNGSRFQ